MEKEKAKSIMEKEKMLRTGGTGQVDNEGSIRGPTTFSKIKLLWKGGIWKSTWMIIQFRFKLTLTQRYGEKPKEEQIGEEHFGSNVWLQIAGFGAYDLFDSRPSLYLSTERQAYPVYACVATLQLS